jgi:hypothetical protein
LEAKPSECSNSLPLLNAAECAYFSRVLLKEPVCLRLQGKTLKLEFQAVLESGSKLPHSESALRAQKLCGIRRLGGGQNISTVGQMLKPGPA